MNTFFTPLPLAPVGNPSASVGARVRRSVRHAGNGLWRLLETIGRARAHGHLLHMADRCQALQPELANEFRAAARQGPMA